MLYAEVVAVIDPAAAPAVEPPPWQPLPQPPMWAPWSAALRERLGILGEALRQQEEALAASRARWAEAYTAETRGGAAASYAWGQMETQSARLSQLRADLVEVVQIPGTREKDEYLKARLKRVERRLAISGADEEERTQSATEQLQAIARGRAARRQLSERWREEIARAEATPGPADGDTEPQEARAALSRLGAESLPVTCEEPAVLTITS